MNFRKWICETFNCAGYQSAVYNKKLKELTVHYLTKLANLNKIVNKKQKTIDELQQKLKSLREKYNAEKKIHRLPDYCKPSECPFNPDNKKKITNYFIVRNGKLYYRGKEIKLCGCSDYEMLARSQNLILDIPEWQRITYDEYCEQLFDYPINYVRVGIIPDYKLIRKFCEDCAKNEIIVELSLLNHVPYDMGDYRKAVDYTIDLGNVFYDVHNEFLKDPTDVAKASLIMNYVIRRGGIVSAGAWGRSKNGESLSQEFGPVSNYNQIISHHRQWTQQDLNKYVKKGKPVIQNEFFDLGNTRPKDYLGFDGYKKLMRNFFDWGCVGVQFYPFIDSWKGQPREGRVTAREYLKFAGQLCEELNS